MLLRTLTLLIAASVALVAPIYGGTAPLRAAANKIDITPNHSVFLAGYGSNRKNTTVHDPIWARCLILESGNTRIAFVACDLIGFPRHASEKIRAQVKSVLPERLYISATHTHSGPDTLGQWGPDIQTSGVDKVWWAETQGRIVQLIEQTATQLQSATLKFANTMTVPKISKNIRVPAILDTELGAMQILDGKGEKVIATFVNYSCHPEVLNSHALSADFPGWLYKTVESKVGGICLYLNGAQGGMVTADYDESISPKGENFKATEEIGTGLANRTLEILNDAPLVKEANIHTQRSVFQIPLENPMFKMLIKLKVFPDETKKGENIETEVNRITIGEAEFLTLPGEVLPNIGFMLKRFMTGKTKFLLGLTCDELGYILSEEDFGLQLYRYEASVSVGSQMGPMMVENLKRLLKEGKR